MFWDSWLRVFSLKRAGITLDGRQPLRKFALGTFRYVLTDSAFLLVMGRPMKDIEFTQRNV